MRCEVVQERIFGIQVSGPACSPELIQHIKPPARCWLSPQLSLPGLL